MLLIKGHDVMMQSSVEGITCIPFVFSATALHLSEDYIVGQ